MADYSVTIVESSRELSPKERVMFKDFSNAEKMEIVMDGDPLVIQPDTWALCDVKNPNSTKNKEYKTIVIIDKAGNKYKTGSDTFIRNFIDIMHEMADATEDWSLEIYGRPSKNYQGKQFLTCSVV